MPPAIRQDDRLRYATQRRRDGLGGFIGPATVVAFTSGANRAVWIGRNPDPVRYARNRASGDTSDCRALRESLLQTSLREAYLDPSNFIDMRPGERRGAETAEIGDLDAPASPRPETGDIEQLRQLRERFPTTRIRATTTRQCDYCGTNGPRFYLGNSRYCYDCFRRNVAGPCSLDGCNEAAHLSAEDGVCPRCFARERERTAHERQSRQREMRSLDGYSNVDSEHAEILNYSYRPEFKMLQKPWEQTVFLGVELELVLRRGKFPRVHEVIKKHADGLWFAKSDSSIIDETLSSQFCSEHTGAEIVFTPMSIATWRDVNLKTMLDELTKMGCTSDVTNTCGLHVHTSLKSGGMPDRVLNIARALYSNFGSDLLCRLSRRRGSAMERWANVPRETAQWHNGRYLALRRTDYSMELRHFNGTLNLQSFRAALQFADAFVRFCQTSEAKYIAMKCNKAAGGTSGLAWQRFQTFVRQSSNYKTLDRYIQSRNLTA